MSAYVDREVGGRNGRRTSEHVLVAERALGKRLPVGAEVHHVDGNKRNNTPGNLVVCQDKKYHHLLHQRQRALKATGNPNLLTCFICKQWDEPRNLIRGNGQIKHRTCWNAYSRSWKVRKAEAAQARFGFGA